MPIVFLCTADDPWALGKAQVTQFYVIPSRHPDAKPDGRDVDGLPVLECPHCHCTFTNTAWLGTAPA